MFRLRKDTPPLFLLNLKLTTHVLTVSGSEKAAW